ncbi:hypothetical protein [Enterocloster sp.]|uniref:hypothetical protein n=1 Tax=Enterocloster sp. TaxID=2719315 RepID=UPI0039938143
MSIDYLKILHEDSDLAGEFDSLFDFFLLDELSLKDEADGRASFTLPVWLLPEMVPAENTTCWWMVPLEITAAKVRQAIWPRAWTLSFL